MPQKGFGNFPTDFCVQWDRWIVYIVSLSADLAEPNPFWGTHGIVDHLLNNFQVNFWSGWLFHKGRHQKYVVRWNMFRGRGKKHNFICLSY